MSTSDPHFRYRLPLQDQGPMEQVRISDNRMRLICRKCNQEFLFYKGMKRWGPVGSGIGYCEAHNPPTGPSKTKKESDA